MTLADGYDRDEYADRADPLQGSDGHGSMGVHPSAQQRREIRGCRATDYSESNQKSRKGKEGRAADPDEFVELMKEVRQRAGEVRQLGQGEELEPIWITIGGCRALKAASVVQIY